MTKEEILRKAFGEDKIEMGVYPDSTLRPAIYRAMEEYAQQQTAELREMLERCDKTFGIIDKIITSLKASENSPYLDKLVNEIDIDLPLAQAQIKDLLNKKP